MYDEHKKMIEEVRAMSDEKKIAILKKMGILDGSAAKRVKANGVSRASDELWEGFMDSLK